MKLLLKRDVPHLGIVGDIVDVAPGYGRNHLLPHGLATQATDSNIKALAEERKKAEERKLKEAMENTPEIADEHVQAMEKERALERVSLRHRSTGKWAKFQQQRAKTDPKV